MYVTCMVLYLLVQIAQVLLHRLQYPMVPGTVLSRPRAMDIGALLFATWALRAGPLLFVLALIGAM
jgi:hypothetical protein